MKGILTIVLICATFCICNGQKEISVVVDERVELITATQLLFGYPLVGQASVDYKTEVENAFTKYAQDSIINNLLLQTQDDFSFSKPFSYTFHFSFPEFIQQHPFSETTVENLRINERKESLQQYNQNLKLFYHKSDFHTFFINHKAFYESMINEVKAVVDKYDLADQLEKYYGQEQKSYTLVLSPLFIEAGMSIWVETKQGGELYSIIGPNLSSKSKPDFDTDWIMQYLVIHEFSHPFCNPLIEKYFPEMQKDSCLFEPIKSALNKQGCGDWKSALCEMLTRANEILIIRNIFGSSVSDKIKADYLKQKWIYLEELIPLMEKYQSDRKKYPNLESIMPEVVETFHRVASGCR